MTLNTLLLLHGLLSQQTISVSASREEIEAVLAAKDELDAAIADHPDTPTAPTPNREQRRAAARKGPMP